MTLFKSFDSYREAWDESFRKTPYIPLNIDIELASLCNLACPFCYFGHDDFRLGKVIKKSFMTTEMAKRMIDESDELGVPAIKMNSRGESTIHPDYTEIMRYAQQKDSFFDILVNTNGNCPEKAIPGLMCASKLMFSLDSFKPDTYAIMRKGGNLRKALLTIFEVLKRGHENVWIRRVITDDNKHENFVQDAKDHFGQNIKVSEHYVFDRNVQRFDDTWERQYCGYPSQRLMVTSIGQVLPCCVDWKAEMVVGDVNKQSLIQIWNGPTMWHLRRELRENVFKSEICKNCTTFMAYKRKERDFVRREMVAG